MDATWPFLSCKWATIEMVSQDMYPLKRALINTTVAMVHAWLTAGHLYPVPYVATLPLQLNGDLLCKTQLLRKLLHLKTGA